MIGIIDAGGGSNDIFGAGVFDFLMDNGIDINYCIGVSEGTPNAASYVSGQRGRIFRSFTEYSGGKGQKDFRHMIMNGISKSTGYIGGALDKNENGETFDLEAFRDSDKTFYVVCTDGITGLAKYYSQEDIKPEDLGMISGELGIPVLNLPYRFGIRKLYDGGVGDPIPYKKALDDGCEKVVVILSAPKDQEKKPGNDARMARLIKRRYPRIAKALADRSVTYNTALAECRKLEEEGRVLILAPEPVTGLKTLASERKKLLRLYEEGYLAAEAVPKFMLG